MFTGFASLGFGVAILAGEVQVRACFFSTTITTYSVVGIAFGCGARFGHFLQFIKAPAVIKMWNVSFPVLLINWLYRHEWLVVKGLYVLAQHRVVGDELQVFEAFRSNHQMDSLEQKLFPDLSVFPACLAKSDKVFTLHVLHELDKQLDRKTV